LKGAADRTGLAFALVGAVAFSGKAIIVKLSYRYGIDAIDAIFVRMVLALPLFLAFAWWGGRGRPPLTSRDRWAVAGLGFCGYYLASLLDFLGLQYVTASLERLILYLNPTVVLLLGWLLFGRRPSPRQWLALAISYLGVAVVFAHEVRLEGRDVLLGSALVLGSVISYAVYLVSSGELVQRLGALRLTGLATSVACVLCVLQFLLLRDPASLLGFAPAVWWLGIVNAVACTAAPVLLVMMAIERIGPANTSQAGMVGPLSTVAMGVLLLGEPFTPTLVLGTLLVLGGITVLARAR
jgi:drug/metabolite transporter (DMT)-like permease